MDSKYSTLTETIYIKNHKTIDDLMSKEINEIVLIMNEYPNDIQYSVPNPQEKDIELILQQVNVTRNQAKAAYDAHGGDIVDAIMHLQISTFY